MSETKTIYDLIIIGAGPAGLAASIYASRYKVKNLVVGPQIGGTITLAHKVENYPGFISIPGFELGQKMAEQVKRLGAEIKLQSVIQISKQDNFEIRINNGEIYYSRFLIVASGTERRKLNIPGEKEYLGKGVSYCSNCDAPFFKGKTVIVIGGGDAAVTGCLHVREFASKTYLIYRGEKEEMRAEPIWLDQLEKEQTVGIFETNIKEILGDGQRVTRVKLDKPYQWQEELLADGVFIEIGAIPVSNLTSSLGVEVDESGFIKVNDLMETNVDGIYAAGDITTKSKNFQQAISATAQGALAASSVFRKLKGKAEVPKQWG